jgi:hypothetical protein
VGNTLLEVAAFSRSIQYIGLEPNPVARFLLKVLAERNNLRAITFPIGCDAQPFAHCSVKAELAQTQRSCQRIDPVSISASSRIKSPACRSTISLACSTWTSTMC